MKGVGKMKEYELEIKTETKLTEEQLDRILGKEPGRPAILPKFVPMYQYECSEIPERIRVSFADGQTAVYELRTEQPAPLVVESIRIIRKWNTGYQAPKRRGKR